MLKFLTKLTKPEDRFKTAEKPSDEKSQSEAASATGEPV
jgi:hypothetical protein